MKVSRWHLVIIHANSESDSNGNIVVQCIGCLVVQPFAALRVVHQLIVTAHSKAYYLHHPECVHGVYSSCVQVGAVLVTLATIGCGDQPLTSNHIWT